MKLLSSALLGCLALAAPVLGSSPSAFTAQQDTLRSLLRRSTHVVSGSADVGASNAALYPKWAHAHWVWLPSFQENQLRDLDFVNNFTKRGIKVGALNIDSRWSTGINNFLWNKEKFPDAKELIAELHKRDIRVICWATSMIDSDSSNYKEAYDKGYFLDDGVQAKWWHGWGSFLDYTNPAALDWWHAQLDYVLDIGLDGFKCDGTDAILFELGGVAWSHKGLITEREYADMYYRDFFYHSRSKNPDALIMARPVDSYAPLDIYLDFAPHDVMFSGWVGDQSPTFAGMQDALRNMFHSAWRGYLNFGSDTGAYRGGTRTKQLFTRWFQLSTFCPLFENGGEGRHGPWEYDAETVTVYKKFVDIHYELGTYLLTTGTERYKEKKSQMQPLAEDTIFTPSTWNFLLGPDILVCPQPTESNSVHIGFPDGVAWVNWFNASQVHQGGSTATLDVPLDTMAVFKKKGSFLPLEVAADSSAHGSAACDDCLTMVVSGVDERYASEYDLAGEPGVASATTPVHEWKGRAQYVRYEYERASSTMFFTATGHGRSLAFHMQLVQRAPASVTATTTAADGAAATRVLPHLDVAHAECQAALRTKGAGWCMPDASSVVVRPGAGASAAPGGVVVAAHGITFA
jgi:alpha-glucosidase (family GH31 glycosyl hydrolase)